jgi:hypothetical protein
MIEGDFDICPFKLFIGAITPNWLMGCKDVSDSAKLCYARLCQYAGDSYEAFPKQETFAQSMGWSVRSLQMYLSELIKFGLIRTVRHGRNKPNSYRFRYHPIMASTLRKPLDTQDLACHNLDTQDLACPDTQDLAYPYNDEENHLRESIKEKNIIKKEKIGFDEEFKEFWKTYPRKVAKKKAEEIYKRILKKGVASHAEVMEGLKSQITDWRNDNRETQYIPHPTTWLNAGRWEDEDGGGSHPAGIKPTIIVEIL